MISKKNRVSAIPIFESNGRGGDNILNVIKRARELRDVDVSKTVGAILKEVRRSGDAALFKYSEQFDKVRLTSGLMRVPIDHLRERAALTEAPFKRAIRAAAGNIRLYHYHQGLVDFKISTVSGDLWQVVKPLRRVGVYIPGGHAVYPSSVLMNIIPAQVAGVKEIVAVTPPRGDIDPGVAYALCYLKIKEVYRIGGAQAIGALAYGTKTIAPVDKIVGPGNLYVAAAKKAVYGVVDIDAIAGPSEVVIIADKTTPPRIVALDLLAQAEHGSGGELAVCMVENKAAAANIAAAVASEIEKSPVKSVFKKLPRHAISIVVTSSRAESFALANAIAPEHLQIMTATANRDINMVENAAAVFVGTNTPAAMGDYYIGTNHVLPTGGAARFASPLGVESFQKRMSVARASQKGVRAAKMYVPVIAKAETFIHHAMSVEARDV